MNVPQLVLWALRTADTLTERLVADMSDIALVRPTVRGGNHALWTMGHLALEDAEIAAACFGTADLPEGWQALFGSGTSAADDASIYPAFEQVVGTYRAQRAAVLERLSALTEAQWLGCPEHVASGSENFLRSVGQAWMVVAMHQMHHVGQLADCRRAAGRDPLQ